MVFPFDIQFIGFSSPKNAAHLTTFIIADGNQTCYNAYVGYIIKQII